MRNDEVKVKVVYEDGYEQRYTEAVIRLLRKSKERRKAAQFHTEQIQVVDEAKRVCV